MKTIKNDNFAKKSQKCIIKFTDQTLYNVHKNILSLLKTYT